MEYNVHLNCVQVHMHKSKWCIETDSILKVPHSRIQGGITHKHSIPHQQEQFHLMKMMYSSLWSAWGLILWCSQCLSTRHLASFGTKQYISFLFFSFPPLIFPPPIFKEMFSRKCACCKCHPRNKLWIAMHVKSMLFFLIRKRNKTF